MIVCMLENQDRYRHYYFLTNLNFDGALELPNDMELESSEEVCIETESGEGSDRGQLDRVQTFAMAIPGSFLSHHKPSKLSNILCQFNFDFSNDEIMCNSLRNKVNGSWLHVRCMWQC